MRSALERRLEILEILDEYRSISQSNLAYMLGVSKNTIYRDICVLSCSYQIFTRCGGPDGGGAVYLQKGYSPFYGRLDVKQQKLLDRLYGDLSDEDKETMQSIIDKFGRRI